jgi:hypothetical protein
VRARKGGHTVKTTGNIKRHTETDRIISDERIRKALINRRESTAEGEFARVSKWRRKGIDTFTAVFRPKKLEIGVHLICKHSSRRTRKHKE